jgi:D-glycerate 3-kinase
MPETNPAQAADWQRSFLDKERLPASYLDVAGRFFDPLAALLAARRGARCRPLRVAINGSQGSGKSTLAAYLVASLAQCAGLRAVALSLDDFYLGRVERERLAAAVHPLLATRGVPGTHDIPLLERTLEALTAEQVESLALPSFDKAADDRRPRDDWPRVATPVDVVLLEGWCLGARAEAPRSLVNPINDLEREEDGDGTWRRYVNAALSRDFELLYPAFDLWVMLAAPSFEQVLAWRTEQEEKLRSKVGGRGAGLMDGPALARFVAHFERQTRNCLAQLPDRVDVLYTLGPDRSIVSSRGLTS